MRLWHYKLIPYLPRTQLIAQWRELNSIFKKQDNHILINYIYDYMGWKRQLLNYSVLVINEMNSRGYSIKKWDNFDSFNETKMNWGLHLGIRVVEQLKAGQIVEQDVNAFYHCPYQEHNNEYLQICIYNLKEKYIRGQKDFSKEQYDRIMETF